MSVVVLGALVRAVPRAPVAGLSGTALLAVPALAWLGGDRGAIAALQISAVALAGVAVTLLQQPRGATDAAPVTIARRRALLLGAALGPFALLWLALLALAGVGGGEAQALTLQLAAVTALALGLGARGEDPARALAAVALTFGASRVLFGPELFPSGTEAARLTGAAGVWAGATCAGLMLLAAFSRDAAARR